MLQRGNKLKREISLSPKAIHVINEILSNGNRVNISLVGQRLRITEIASEKVKYDTMIPKE